MKRNILMGEIISPVTQQADILKTSTYIFVKDVQKNFYSPLLTKAT